jgi:hypothetical protein
MRAFEFLKEWRNAYTISNLEHMPYDSEEWENLYTSARPTLDRWRGPQEGKYLQLMLAGMKPASILNLPQDKERFLPYIKSGKLIKAGTIRDDWIITLPGEEWRAKQLQKFIPQLKMANSTYQPSSVIRKLDAKIGMLLGIPKEAVKMFVNQYR